MERECPEHTADGWARCAHYGDASVRIFYCSHHRHNGVCVFWSRGSGGDPPTRRLGWQHCATEEEADQVFEDFCQKMRA